MKGYTDFTLSYMDVGSFNVSEEDKKLLKGAEYCRYFGYREPPNSTKPYALTSAVWHIVVARFIFAIVFIVSVYLIIEKSLQYCHSTPHLFSEWSRQCSSKSVFLL
ncbi:unnamed protein product [Hymenolepis diminuta]|uniref:Cation_ATPase_N domain-containing protein n=1 Tax=Hymenolepis diminuta TaxID=6216 RepID=A0A0R3SLY6_HYMDI|nr:unnamed protein product [Hymenolepis diminuta]